MVRLLRLWRGSPSPLLPTGVQEGETDLQKLTTRWCIMPYNVARLYSPLRHWER
jgi:hypothetical protein